MQRKLAVLYWQGIVDPHNLHEKYSHQIKRLLAGEYAELNLEKLRGCGVYSIRINQADRLLLTTVEIDGVNSLLILDEVLNHDYHRSKMLQPKTLRNYLELNAPDFANHVITSADFETTNELRNAPVKHELGGFDPVYSAVKYYQFRYLNFSVTQEEIVNHPRLQFPMVITGAAGTGKTCIIIAMMSRLAAEGNLPLAYVCESAELCDMAKTAWAELPIASKCSEQDVQFITYEQLLASQFAEKFAAGAKLVAKDRFMSFLKEQIKHKRKALKAKPDPAFTDKFLNDLNTIYQECRIVSAFDATEEKYKKLGAKQSHFKEESIRTWLLQVTKDYLASLQDNEIDPAFTPFSANTTFNTVFVDEAQDFSLRQLMNLCQLAENNRVCYCEDPRQSLLDTIAKSTLFSVLFDGKHTKYELVDSYRCPPEILKVVNAVERMKAVAAGGKFQGVDENSQLGRTGQVTVHDHLSDEVCAAIRERAQSSKLAVITTEENRAEAVKRFGTELVFTPKQIKGLEYEEIVCFRLVQGVELAPANKLIQRWRNKENFVSSNEHTTNFNTLFTAVTRARSCLTIVEDQAHSVAAIVSVMKEAATTQKKMVGEKIPATQKLLPSTPEEWSQEADKQIKLRNTDVAENIYLNTLKKTEAEFIARCRQFGVIVAPKQTPKQVTPVVTAEKKSTKPKIVKQSLFQGKAKGIKNLDVLTNKPSDADLDALFALPTPELVTTLLCTPLPKFNNLNLLTQLSFSPHTRKKIITHYIPKYFEQLAPHFNPVNFSGSSNSGGTTYRAALIHAIGLSKESLTELLKIPCFVDTFASNANVKALFGMVKHEGTYLTSLMHFLSLNEETLFLFIECIERNTATVFKEFEKDDYLLRPMSGEMTDESRSIFTNLLLHGKVGWRLLNTILANTNLTKKISLPELFPLSSEMDAMRLETMTHDEDGAALLKQIMEKGQKPQPYNKATTSRDNLSVISQHVRMLRFVGDQADHIENNIVSLVRIIATEKDQNRVHSLIDDIFTAKREQRNVFLFCIPPSKHGHDCLFTLLFDLPVSRQYMLETILPKYGESLAGNMTSTALCRTKVTSCRTATGAARKLPPIMWIACVPALTGMAFNWIETRGVFKMMRVEALFMSISPDYFTNLKSSQYNCYTFPDFRPCTNINATVLHVLALSKQGMTMLSLVSMFHPFSPFLTTKMLFEKSIVDVKANETLSLIEQFANHNLMLATNVLEKSPDILVEAMSDDYLGAHPTLLFKLLKVDKFDNFLFDALYDTNSNHQLAFTKALLYPLSAESDDNSQAVTLFNEELVYSSSYLKLVTQLLMQNPEAVSVLDVRLFIPNQEDCDYLTNVCPNKVIAVKILLSERTKETDDFLELALSLLNERKQRNTSTARIC